MKKVLGILGLLLGCMIVLAGCKGESGETKAESGGSKETEATMTETENTNSIEESTEETLPETTEAAPYPELTDGIYTMKSLQGWAKFHNRHYFLKNGAMAADWSASGFTMNANVTGGSFGILYKSEYTVYVSVVVDGVEADRPRLESGEGIITVPVSEGVHEISVYKENEINPSGKAFNLVGVKFEGEILEKPADAPLYVEYIGDSISCGDGSLGVYTSGVVWGSEDHSGTHGFPFFLSEMIGADYSIVAKGGIGLLNPSGEYAMGELYPYVTGYRDHIVAYDFERVPDLIILELGANDGGYEEIEFYNKLKEFIELIRVSYGPDVPIVWFGSNERFYGSMKRYMMTVKNEDPNLYAMMFAYGGSGSAALATQSKGHPNAAEQQEIADKIYEFLKEKDLIQTGE